VHTKSFFIKAIALTLCITFTITNSIAYSDAPTISGAIGSVLSSVSNAKLPAAAPKLERYLREENFPSLQQHAELTKPRAELRTVETVPMVDRQLSAWIGRGIAAVLYVVVLPVIYTLAFIRKLVTNNGPMFFFQERVGYEGKTIVIKKIKTMSIDWDYSPESITPFQNFLRKTALDELPQLWSIAKGEMQWFGPRPLLRKEIGEDYIQKVLFKTKPGLFSSSVLKRGIGSGRLISTEEVITDDLNDIEKRSFVYNTILLIRSVWAICFGAKQRIKPDFTSPSISSKTFQKSELRTIQAGSAIDRPASAQDNGVLAINGSQLFRILNHKYDSRNLLRGGPIRQPDFIVFKRNQGLIEQLIQESGAGEINDSSYLPDFANPADIKDFKSIANEIASGKFPLPLVYKGNGGQQGEDTFFLTKNDAGDLVITMTYNTNPLLNLKAAKAVKQYFEQSGKAKEIEENSKGKDIIQFVIDSSRHDLSDILFQVWALVSTAHKYQYDSGMMESMVPAVKMGSGAYETRHAFSGNLRDGNYQKAEFEEADYYENWGTFARVGSSGFFSNLIGRSIFARRFEQDKMFVFLYQHFQIPPEAQERFKIYVDNLLEKEFQHLIKRLKAAGIKIDADIRGQFDLMWLEHVKTEEGFPVPVIIEAGFFPRDQKIFDQSIAVDRSKIPFHSEPSVNSKQSIVSWMDHSKKYPIPVLSDEFKQNVETVLTQNSESFVRDSLVRLTGDEKIRQAAIEQIELEYMDSADTQYVIQARVHLKTDEPAEPLVFGLIAAKTPEKNFRTNFDFKNLLKLREKFPNEARRYLQEPFVFYQAGDEHHSIFSVRWLPDYVGLNRAGSPYLLEARPLLFDLKDQQVTNAAKEDILDKDGTLSLEKTRVFIRGVAKVLTVFFDPVAAQGINPVAFSSHIGDLMVHRDFSKNEIKLITASWMNRLSVKDFLLNMSNEHYGELFFEKIFITDRAAGIIDGLVEKYGRVEGLRIAKEWSDIETPIQRPLQDALGAYGSPKFRAGDLTKYPGDEVFKQLLIEHKGNLTKLSKTTGFKLSSVGAWVSIHGFAEFGRSLREASGQQKPRSKEKRSNPVSLPAPKRVEQMKERTDKEEENAEADPVRVTVTREVKKIENGSETYYNAFGIEIHGMELEAQEKASASFKAVLPDRTPIQIKVSIQKDGPPRNTYYTMVRLYGHTNAIKLYWAEALKKEDPERILSRGIEFLFLTAVKYDAVSGKLLLKRVNSLHQLTADGKHSTVSSRAGTKAKKTLSPSKQSASTPNKKANLPDGPKDRSELRNTAMEAAVLGLALGRPVSLDALPDRQLILNGKALKSFSQISVEARARSGIRQEKLTVDVPQNGNNLNVAIEVNSNGDDPEQFSESIPQSEQTWRGSVAIDGQFLEVQWTSEGLRITQRSSSAVSKITALPSNGSSIEPVLVVPSKSSDLRHVPLKEIRIAEAVAASFHRIGYSKTLKTFRLRGRYIGSKAYFHYIGLYKKWNRESRTDYFALSYDEAMEYIINQKKVMGRGLITSKKTAVNLMLAALDYYIPGFKDLRLSDSAKEPKRVQKMLALYEKEVIGYLSKKPSKNNKAKGGQLLFFTELGRLGWVLRNNLPYLGKDKIASLLKAGIPELAKALRPTVLSRKKYWTEEKIKEHVWRGLDPLGKYRFKKLRLQTNKENPNRVREMAEIYRREVIPFFSKRLKKFGQVAFFKDRSGISRGSIYYFLKIAIPELVDQTNPDALKLKELKKYVLPPLSKRKRMSSRRRSELRNIEISQASINRDARESSRTAQSVVSRAELRSIQDHSEELQFKSPNLWVVPKTEYSKEPVTLLERSFKTQQELQEFFGAVGWGWEPEKGQRSRVFLANLSDFENREPAAFAIYELAHNAFYQSMNLEYLQQGPDRGIRIKIEFFPYDDKGRGFVRATVSQPSSDERFWTQLKANKRGVDQRGIEYLEDRTTRRENDGVWQAGKGLQTVSKFMRLMSSTLTYKRNSQAPHPIETIFEFELNRSELRQSGLIGATLASSRPAMMSELRTGLLNTTASRAKHDAITEAGLKILENGFPRFTLDEAESFNARTEDYFNQEISALMTNPETGKIMVSHLWKNRDAHNRFLNVNRLPLVEATLYERLDVQDDGLLWMPNHLVPIVGDNIYHQDGTPFSEEDLSRAKLRKVIGKDGRPLKIKTLATGGRVIAIPGPWVVPYVSEGEGMRIITTLKELSDLYGQPVSHDGAVKAIYELVFRNKVQLNLASALEFKGIGTDKLILRDDKTHPNLLAQLNKQSAYIPAANIVWLSRWITSLVRGGAGTLFADQADAVEIDKKLRRFGAVLLADTVVSYQLFDAESLPELKTADWFSTQQTLWYSIRLSYNSARLSQFIFKTYLATPEDDEPETNSILAMQFYRDLFGIKDPQKIKDKVIEYSLNNMAKNLRALWLSKYYRSPMSNVADNFGPFLELIDNASESLRQFDDQKDAGRDLFFDSWKHGALSFVWTLTEALSEKGNGDLNPLVELTEHESFETFLDILFQGADSQRKREIENSMNRLWGPKSFRESMYQFYQFVKQNLETLKKSELRSVGTDSSLKEFHDLFSSRNFNPKTALYANADYDARSIVSLLALFPTLEKIFLVTPSYQKDLADTPNLNWLFDPLEQKVANWLSPSAKLSLLKTSDIKASIEQGKPLVAHIQLGDRKADIVMVSQDYAQFHAEEPVDLIFTESIENTGKLELPDLEKISGDLTEGGMLLLLTEENNVPIEEIGNRFSFLGNFFNESNPFSQDVFGVFIRSYLSVFQRSELRAGQAPPSRKMEFQRVGYVPDSLNSFVEWRLQLAMSKDYLDLDSLRIPPQKISVTTPEGQKQGQRLYIKGQLNPETRQWHVQVRASKLGNFEADYEVLGFQQQARVPVKELSDVSPFDQKRLQEILLFIAKEAAQSDAPISFLEREIKFEYRGIVVRAEKISKYLTVSNTAEKKFETKTRLFFDDMSDAYVQKIKSHEAEELQKPTNHAVTLALNSDRSYTIWFHTSNARRSELRTVGLKEEKAAESIMKALAVNGYHAKPFTLITVQRLWRDSHLKPLKRFEAMTALKIAIDRGWIENMSRNPEKDRNYNLRMTSKGIEKFPYAPDQAFLDYFRKAIGIGDSVADIGVENGRLAILAADSGAEVDVIESDKKILEEAQTQFSRLSPEVQNRITLITGHLFDNTTLKEKRYDAIVLSTSLFDLRYAFDDLKLKRLGQFFKSAISHLKPYGKIILIYENHIPKESFKILKKTAGNWWDISFMLEENGFGVYELMLKPYDQFTKTHIQKLAKLIQKLHIFLQEERWRGAQSAEDLEVLQDIDGLFYRGEDLKSTEELLTTVYAYGDLVMNLIHLYPALQVEAIELLSILNQIYFSAYPDELHNRLVSQGNPEIKMYIPDSNLVNLVKQASELFENLNLPKYKDGYQVPPDYLLEEWSENQQKEFDKADVRTRELIREMEKDGEEAQLSKALKDLNQFLHSDPEIAVYGRYGAMRLGIYINEIENALKQLRRLNNKPSESISIYNLWLGEKLEFEFVSRKDVEIFVRKMLLSNSGKPGIYRGFHFNLELRRGNRHEREYSLTIQDGSRALVGGGKVFFERGELRLSEAIGELPYAHPFAFNLSVREAEEKFFNKLRSVKEDAQVFIVHDADGDGIPSAFILQAFFASFIPKQNIHLIGGRAPESELETSINKTGNRENNFVIFTDLQGALSNYEKQVSEGARKKVAAVLSIDHHPMNDPSAPDVLIHPTDKWNAQINEEFFPSTVTSLLLVTELIARDPDMGEEQAKDFFEKYLLLAVFALHHDVFQLRSRPAFAPWHNFMNQAKNRFHYPLEKYEELINWLLLLDRLTVSEKQDSYWIEKWLEPLAQELIKAGKEDTPKVYGQAFEKLFHVAAPHFNDLKKLNDLINREIQERHIELERGDPIIFSVIPKEKIEQLDLVSDITPKIRIVLAGRISLRFGKAKNGSKPSVAVVFEQDLKKLTHWHVRFRSIRNRKHVSDLASRVNLGSGRSENKRSGLLIIGETMNPLTSRPYQSVEEAMSVIRIENARNLYAVDENQKIGRAFLNSSAADQAEWGEFLTKYFRSFPKEWLNQPEELKSLFPEETKLFEALNRGEIPAMTYGTFFKLSSVYQAFLDLIPNPKKNPLPENAELITLPGFNGAKVDGWMMRAAESNGAHPVFVLLPPWGKDASWLAEQAKILQREYPSHHILALNYHGERDGKRILNSGGMIESFHIESAVRAFLAQAGLKIDPSQVVGIGYSQGANILASIQARNPLFSAFGAVGLHATYAAALLNYHTNEFLPVIRRIFRKYKFINWEDPQVVQYSENMLLRSRLKMNQLVIRESGIQVSTEGDTLLRPQDFIQKLQIPVYMAFEEDSGMLGDSVRDFYRNMAQLLTAQKGKIKFHAYPGKHNEISFESLVADFKPFLAKARPELRSPELDVEGIDFRFLVTNVIKDLNRPERLNFRLSDNAMKSISRRFEPNYFWNRLKDRLGSLFLNAIYIVPASFILSSFTVLFIQSNRLPPLISFLPLTYFIVVFVIGTKRTVRDVRSLFDSSAHTNGRSKKVLINMESVRQAHGEVAHEVIHFMDILRVVPNLRSMIIASTADHLSEIEIVSSALSEGSPDLILEFIKETLFDEQSMADFNLGRKEIFDTKDSAEREEFLFKDTLLKQARPSYVGPHEYDYGYRVGTRLAGMAYRWYEEAVRRGLTNEEAIDVAWSYVRERLYAVDDKLTPEETLRVDQSLRRVIHQKSRPGVQFASRPGFRIRRGTSQRERDSRREPRSELRADLSQSLTLEKGKRIPILEGYEARLEDDGKVSFWRTEDGKKIAETFPKIQPVPVWDSERNTRLGFLAFTYQEIKTGDSSEKKLVQFVAFDVEPIFGPVSPADVNTAQEPPRSELRLTALSRAAGQKNLKNEKKNKPELDLDALQAVGEKELNNLFEMVDTIKEKNKELLRRPSEGFSGFRTFLSQGKRIESGNVDLTNAAPTRSAMIFSPKFNDNLGHSFRDILAVLNSREEIVIYYDSPVMRDAILRLIDDVPGSERVQFVSNDNQAGELMRDLNVARVHLVDFGEEKGSTFIQTLAWTLKNTYSIPEIIENHVGSIDEFMNLLGITITRIAAEWQSTLLSAKAA